MLEKLYNNSKMAINDKIYDIDKKLPQSKCDLISTLKTSTHPVLITEIKFSSPSLGKIKDIVNPAEIAKSMVSGGSKAISVLTQPYLFNGSPQYFISVRQAVDVPLLMKDIFVDFIQIDAACNMGADYILLIQSLFDKNYLYNIEKYIKYAHDKNLKVLLEVHTKKELDHALLTDADIIGVNNRDLDTLEIDLTTSEIIKGVKESRPLISESGINTIQDIKYLQSCGVDGFLIGSSIMKRDNIEKRISELVAAY